MRVNFKTKEIVDLLVSGIILTVAFWIFWDGSVGILEIILGTTTGFLLHELAHKFVAQYMRYSAHFEMWKIGALAAIITPFFGFIFAAPGAVQIGSRIDLWGRKFIKNKQIGIIGLSGPATNIVLAIVFIIVGIFYIPFKNAIFINLFLAGFNMIPFGPLDGAKVKNWSWWAWGATIAAIMGVSFAFSKLI